MPQVTLNSFCRPSGIYFETFQYKTTVIPLLLLKQFFFFLKTVKADLQNIDLISNPIRWKIGEWQYIEILHVLIGRELLSVRL